MKYHAIVLHHCTLQQLVAPFSIRLPTDEYVRKFVFESMNICQEMKQKQQLLSNCPVADEITANVIGKAVSITVVVCFQSNSLKAVCSFEKDHHQMTAECSNLLVSSGIVTVDANPADCLYVTAMNYGPRPIFFRDPRVKESGKQLLKQSQ